MQKFALGPVTAYHKIEGGEIVEFPARGPRKIYVDLVSNCKVELWSADNVDMDGAVLVGAGEGMVTTEYTAAGESYLEIRAEKDGSVFMRGWAPDQRVKSSDGPSFTSVEPRVRQNSEYDRMMMVMKFNEQQRQAQLASDRAELASKMAALDAKLKAAEPSPVVDPAPVVEPEPVVAPVVTE